MHFELQRFLKLVEALSDHSLFDVQTLPGIRGGAEAESVDLPGSLLIGAFIVTLGLPPVSVTQDHLQARLDKLFGAGHGYADLVPAMQRVVQAAGHVLRTPQDRGWLGLLDDRYRRAEVSELLPPWWRLAETPQALGLATVIGGCDGLERIDAESADDVACVTR